MPFPKGQHRSKETKKKISEALKGKTGYWLGKKMSNEVKKKMSLKRKGVKFTKEHKENISKAMGGERHRLWKGDRVGYKSLHQWVARELGRADKCSNCGSTENIEWANKSREYKRKLNDWVKLCKKCHCVYDRKKWGKATKTFDKNSNNGLGKRL